MNVNPGLVTWKAGAAAIRRRSEPSVDKGLRRMMRCEGSRGSYRDPKSGLAPGWAVGGRGLQSDTSPPAIADAVQGALR